MFRSRAKYATRAVSRDRLALQAKWQAATIPTLERGGKPAAYTKSQPDASCQMFRQFAMRGHATAYFCDVTKDPRTRTSLVKGTVPPAHSGSRAAHKRKRRPAEGGRDTSPEGKVVTTDD